MNLNTVNQDWRKRASAQLNDDEVEVAFMRQAFTFVESKAAPLLREPFFLGFEIINKNDANTNIVGLFVFRVDKSLLYAPVFFKNGEVKGAHMLYDSKLKLFSPLVPEWCNYYVGRYSNEEGSKVDGNKAISSGRGINFDNLRVPDSIRKSASADWKEMCKQAKSAGEKLLPKLLKTEEGHESFKKIASAIEQDFDFANAMNESYEPSEWLDMDHGFKKEAAVTEPDTLIIHIGEFNPNENVSKERLFGFGADFTDLRVDHAEVYEERETCGEQIRGEGVCKVLDHVGEWKRLLVIPNPEYVYLNYGSQAECRSPADYYGDVYKNPTSTNDIAEAGYDVKNSYDRDPNRYFIVDLDTKEQSHLYSDEPLMGMYIEEETLNDVTVAVSELKKGDHAVLIDGCHISEDPFKVTKVSSSDGITELECESNYGRSYTVKINDSLEKHSKDLGVYSQGTRAVKVSKPEKESDGYSFYKSPEFKPGSVGAMTDFLADNGVKRASVEKVAHANRYVLHCNGQRTMEMNKFAAASILAKGMRIKGDTAIGLVEDAAKVGKRNFLLKSARVSLDEPIPQDIPTMDPEFGVPIESSENYTLSTRSDGPKPVESETGDMYQMDGMQVLIETGTPKELYEASQTVKDDSLFDMGVVGSLVRTFDAAEMVEGYVPDLRQGLDKLGRILFLIYWKPEDFVESYGSDDVADIENKLLGSFRQFGDIILDLMQQFKFEDKVDMNSLRGSN